MQTVEQSKSEKAVQVGASRLW